MPEVLLRSRAFHRREAEWGRTIPAALVAAEAEAEAVAHQHFLAMAAEQVHPAKDSLAEVAPLPLSWRQPVAVEVPAPQDKMQQQMTRHLFLIAEMAE